MYSGNTERLKPIVLTMGKVASTSVMDAIDEAQLSCTHIHSLSPQVLFDEAIRHIRRGNFPPRHIWRSLKNRHRLTGKDGYLFISLVRDPVARNMSAFFQNMKVYQKSIRRETNLDSLFQKFLENFDHELPINWFDREFGDILGIDVYSQTFDLQNKFVFLEEHNTVIFRVDCSDKVKSTVLSEILGARIEVKEKNVGVTKDYSDLYVNMKARATFPTELLEKIYGSRFSQHFWSKLERNEFISRWSKGN